MEHSLLILCALLLNAALGGPKSWYAAVGLTRLSAMPSRAVRNLERKLNREYRSPVDRQVRGWLLVTATALAGVVLGSIGSWSDLIELVVLAILLPVRPIWDRALAMRRALISVDIPAARNSLNGTPWRHYALLDEFGLARAAMETSAIEFSEKVVAPVIFYLVFGLPGFLVCRLITLLHDALAYAPDFGKGARIAHGIIQAIPARMAAALWLASSAFLPGGVAASSALLPLFLQAAPRRLCLAVAAAVSRVSLGGPTSPYLTVWVESGTAKATPADIARAQLAYALAGLFLFIGVGLL